MMLSCRLGHAPVKLTIDKVAHGKTPLFGGQPAETTTAI
jgi:hypothetical protein